MRSLKLTLVTVLLLLAGFFIYWCMQPGSEARRNAADAGSPLARPLINDTSGIAGPGLSPRIKKFNNRTGALMSQFMAEQYVPHEDGSIHVTRPQAEFFLSGGQILRIEGATGIITVPEMPRKDNANLKDPAPIQPPSRGQLYDVTIYLFESQRAADAKQPSLTTKLNNATFDNETFLIYTESYTDSAGRQIARDQVPVSLRGADYDFDGRGLSIRWNERDQRLEMMEVAHGERLIVKHPNRIPLTASSSKQRQTANPPAPATQTLAAAPTPSASAEPSAEANDQLYRATFHDNIRIMQDNQTLLKGDHIDIDFLLAKDRPAVSPTEETSQQAAAEPSPQQQPTPATSTAAAQPGVSPVIVTWSGKLRLVPATPGPNSPATAGDAVATVIGAPVLVERDGSRITCASIVYQTQGGILQARKSDRFGVKLTDARGAVIATDLMQFNQSSRSAVLSGISHADLPVRDDAAPGQTLKADWTESCTLHFQEGKHTGDELQNMAIESAALRGNVNIDHPQLRLRSASLDLHLDPSAKSPSGHRKDAPPQLALRSMDAQGNVLCTLIDSKAKKTRDIRCDHLSMETALAADASLYPRKVNADGHVHTFDDEQELHAGNLAILLKPADRKSKSHTPRRENATDTSSVELESLTALHDVKAVAKDGSTATGDEVRVVMEGDKPQVKLTGQPAALASKDARITGPLITISGKDEQAEVVGPGTLHSERLAQDPSASPRPVDVSWTGGALLQGQRNLIDITGKVSVVTVENDGSVSTAEGDQVRLTLAPKPSTAATQRPIQASADSPAHTDFIKNKAVRNILFSAADAKQFATLQSVLPAADGTPVRQFDLFASQFRFEMAEDGQQRLQRMVVPVPGRMLFVDHRPAPARKTNDPAQSNGDTAFSWEKEMVFDQTAHQIVMSDKVFIRHEPLGQEEKPFQLYADKVLAELDSAPVAQSASGATPVQIKRLLAEGSVQFKAKDMTFYAQSFEFNPQTHVVIGRGTSRQPVQIEMEGTHGQSTTTAESIQFNVQTGELKATNIGAAVRP